MMAYKRLTICSILMTLWQLFIVFYAWTPPKNFQNNYSFGKEKKGARDLKGYYGINVQFERLFFKTVRI